MQKILQQIKENLNDAVRAKDERITAVLRMLVATLKNKEIELRNKAESELTDEIIIKAIQGEIKKRRDSASAYKEGKREDLAAKELNEIEVLKKYLPEQMSDEEIEKIIKEVIANIPDASPGDFGKVMGQVMPKIQGKADGNKVSGILKQLLAE